MLMYFFTLKKRLLFSTHEKIGLKLLKRLRLKFIHFNELTFRHQINDCVSSMCYRGVEIKTTKHFFCVANSLSVREEISMKAFI